MFLRVFLSFSQTAEEPVSYLVPPLSQATRFFVQTSPAMLELDCESRGSPIRTIGRFDFAQPIQFTREHSVRGRLSRQREQNSRPSGTRRHDLGGHKRGLGFARSSGLLDDEHPRQTHVPGSLDGSALSSRRRSAVRQVESSVQQEVGAFSAIAGMPWGRQLHAGPARFDAPFMHVAIEKRHAVIVNG